MRKRSSGRICTARSLDLPTASAPLQPSPPNIFSFGGEGWVRGRRMEPEKRLRRASTDAEKKLWSHLRSAQLGEKFRRQHEILGYIVDFVSIERRLIVELDGGQHA